MNNFEQKIEAFLNKEMTTEESTAFEQKIEKDPEARKVFELYRDMHIIYNDADWKITDSSSKHPKIKQHEDFFKSEKGKTLANSIQNVEKEYFNTTSKNQTRQYFYSACAIAAFLVFGIFMFSKLSTKKDDHRDLYVTYKDWSDLPSLTLRGDANNLVKAEKLFRQKNYTEALTLFKKYQKENNTTINWQALLYTGIAQLETNQNEAAIASFEKLKNSSSLDANKAYWYLALAYLKTNKPNNALKELRQLSKDPDNYKYKTGIELLKKIE